MGCCKAWAASTRGQSLRDRPISLDDLRGYNENPVWGGMVYENLLQAAKLQARQRMAIPQFSAPSGRFRVETLLPGAPLPPGIKEEDRPSDAFGVRASPESIETQIREALSAIDAIQKWPASVPEIPLYQAVRAPGEYGGFYHDNGVARAIEVNQSGPHPRLTTAHEVGHRFDLELVGKPGEFSSEGADDVGSPLHEWWQAVKGSHRFGNLTETVNDLTFGGDAAEFLKKRELFARSYAQYVARKSGHTQILGELQESQKSYGMESYRQWEDEDFVEIEASFDKLLTRLGMLP